MSGETLRALIVDDDREMRESLSELLDCAGWQAQVAPNGREALQKLARTSPDAIVSDVRMPGMTGLELLQSIPGPTPPPMVLISAHGDIPMAVEAMQAGAYTFLEKPFDPRRLLTALTHAAEQHRLRQSTDRLRARLSSLSGLDRVLLGETRAIKTLRAETLDLADTDATVLLQGETGTGKELVARALHDLSRRAGRPFVAVSCATLPAAHFETTLFGEAGDGLLAKADGGTLFLDEVAACPPDVQAKLLRVLETREYFPLHQTTPRKLNIRVISASNEQLEQAVADGRFREDLMFRLNAVMLNMPPLRERRDDIPLLYAHFAAEYATLYETDAPEINNEGMVALLAHSWPGNVRELRHTAERRVLAARRGTGSIAQALMADATLGDVPGTLREAVAAFERQLIARALKAQDGRMDDVAETLGIGRRTLNEKIVKLGLEKEKLL